MQKEVAFEAFLIALICMQIMKHSFSVFSTMVADKKKDVLLTTVPYA